MMNIGIDCWALRLNGGGARFVFESIFEKFQRFNEGKIILFLHPEANEVVNEVEFRCGKFKNIIKIKITDPEEIYQYQKYVDVFYSPFNNNSFRYYSRPVVSLLHDIQEKYFPEYFDALDLQSRLEDYNDILNSSDSIITISKFCKDSFVEYYSVDSKKVHVVYNGAQESLLKHIQVKIRVSDRYIFYPANFYPHKNHEKLFEALSHVYLKDKEFPCLYLLGKSWSSNVDPEKLVNKFSLESKVRIFSDLQPEEVAKLYMGAEYIVIPSKFEGFCMPVVESIIFGKKLICSNLAVFDEIIGRNNYISFDPYNADDIAEKLILGLNIKKDLGNLNVDQVINNFNWDNAYNKTKDILEKTYKTYYNNKNGKECFLVLTVSIDSYNVNYINQTIKSLNTQKRSSLKLKVCFLLRMSFNKAQEFLGECSPLFEYSIFLRKEELVSYLFEISIENLIFQYVDSGTVFYDTYFLNVFNMVCSFNKESFFAETHQIHENREQSFEMCNYFRINNSHYVLNGKISPEFFLTRNIVRISNIISAPFNFSDIIVEVFRENSFILVRKVLAKVLYRNVYRYFINGEKMKRVGFIPPVESYIKNIDKKLIGNIKKNQLFLNYVNSKIASRLGYDATFEVNELKNQLKKLEYYE